MHKSFTLSLRGLAVLFLVCLPNIAKVDAQTTSYTVRRIIDGDTYEVTAKDNLGKYIQVRLACVDAPETSATYKNKRGYADQSYWGSLATNRVAQLITQSNGTIRFTPNGTSSYDRLVGNVQLSNGVSVQETLAWEGLGVIDPRYIGSCSAATKQYQSFSQWYKWGIWSDPYFLAPWIFRNQ